MPLKEDHLQKSMHPPYHSYAHLQTCKGTVTRHGMRASVAESICQSGEQELSLSSGTVLLEILTSLSLSKIHFHRLKFV